MSEGNHIIYVLALLAMLVALVYTQQTIAEITKTQDTIVVVTPLSFTHDNFSSVVKESSDTISYTEEFITRLAGRNINLQNLLLEYSLVCPIQQSCDGTYDGIPEYVFDLPAVYESGCKPCSCDRDCLEDGNCCPSTHYGYVHHQCMNKIVYPETETWTSYMADTCIDSYTMNETMIELCKSEYRPCTTPESRLIYKNEYCAQCSNDGVCVPWKLNVNCMYSILSPGTFESLSELKAFIDQYGCKIQYEPSFVVRIGHMCDWKDYFQTVYIDRCNVTGLWTLYDADIEWACENFHNPYKDFRNIYCYICNPSHAKEQFVPLVDYCDLPANGNDTFLYEACKNFSESSRLQPFKNIFCYTCIDGAKMLQNSNTEMFSLYDVSETHDRVTLETQLNFSLIFQSENKIQDVQYFIHNSILETFVNVNVNTDIHKETDKTSYHISSLEQIINYYTTVCGTTNLCNDTLIDTNTSDKYGNPACGWCSCETYCGELDNCCLDTILIKQPYACMNTLGFPFLRKQIGENTPWHKPALDNNVYQIIDTCLTGNPLHQLARKCSTYETTSDVLSSIPISTSGADVAYKNIYCYICNNNKSDIILNIQAQCETPIEHTLFTDVSQLLDSIKSHCHQLSFVPLPSKQCNGYDPIEASFEGGRKYVRKEERLPLGPYKFVEHKSIQSRNLLDPVKDVYSACNQTRNLEDDNSLLKDICENQGVDIMSLPEYPIDSKVYKNFACFLCNPDIRVSEAELVNLHMVSDCFLDNSTEWYEPNEAIERLCRASERTLRWFPYSNMYCAECNLPPLYQIEVIVNTYDVLSPTVYSYLFSLSPEDLENMDGTLDEDDTPSCPQGTYDYSLKRCRSLHCSDGYQLFNTSCKPVLETVSGHIYDISFTLQREEKTIFMQHGKADLSELCFKIGNKISESFGQTTEFVMKKIQCTIPQVCESWNNFAFGFDFYTVEYIDVSATFEIAYTESVSKVRISLVSAINKTYLFNNIVSVDGRLQTSMLHSYPGNKWTPFQSNAVCLFLGSGEIFSSEPVQTPIRFGFAFYIVDKFLICPFVKIKISESSFLNESQSIILNETGMIFIDNEYKIEGNTVLICFEDYDKQNLQPHAEEGDTDTMSYILDTFTLVCTIISLTCLMLTFTTYSLFSSLQSVPGKCVMLLCFSLFIAQGFLQFGLKEIKIESVCIIIGVSIHYFWMAAFCAMNVCSFHMFRVFYFNDLSNELPRNQTRLFKKYFLYFAAFPLSMVLITIVVNFANATTFDFGYGEHYCFISNFYSFIGTFLTPACLIFLSNAIMFSLAFYKIQHSPNVKSNHEKKNFFIFLKLCTIVGVSWPLLIIDSALEIPWLTFIVSGINSLQGVLIFVSFILNRRVLFMYKSLWKTKTEQSVYGKYQSTNDTDL